MGVCIGECVREYDNRCKLIMNSFIEFTINCGRLHLGKPVLSVLVNRVVMLWMGR